MKKIILQTARPDGLPVDGFKTDNPFWVINQHEQVFTVVTFIRDHHHLDAVKNNSLWPDAFNITVVANIVGDSYDFTESLPEPQWFSSRKLVPIILGTVILTKQDN